MNLDEFLENIKPEIKLNEEKEQNTEQLIKNLDKERLNVALKNADRINVHMKQLGSSVSGPLKNLILQGAVSAFKKSRAEALDVVKKVDDKINDYADKTVKLLEKAESSEEAEMKIDKNEAKFRDVLDNLTAMILEEFGDASEDLVKRNSVAINTDRLKGAEERKYHDLSNQIIEYYVRELLKIRSVLSAFQTMLARVRKNTEYDYVVMDRIPPIFESYVKGKFGLETGKYLVAHVKKYYNSTNDRKAEFEKFENLINYLLGVV